MTFDTTLPPFITELDSRKITYEADYEDDADYVLWYKYQDKLIPLAALGDIIYIYGREKSRKSLLKDCIVSSNYTQEPDSCLNFVMKLPEGSNVLNLDLEQPRYQTKKNYHRFMNMVGYETDLPNYHTYNIRPYWYSQKLDQIKYLCDTIGNVKLLVIDQFVNLCENENDDKSIHEARFAIERAAEEYGCLVQTLIHTNRGGKNSNGKAGAILDKIGACALRVEYTEETGVSDVIHTHSRGRRMPKFSFKHKYNVDMPKFVDVYPTNDFIK